MFPVEQVHCFLQTVGKEAVVKSPTRPCQKLSGSSLQPVNSCVSLTVDTSFQLMSLNSSLGQLSGKGGKGVIFWGKQTHTT